MKALLYKDFLLLWRSDRSFFFYAAVLAVVPYWVLDGELAVAHGIILLLLTILTPADLGAHWLDPLPLSPKALVWSKYIVLWCLEGLYFLLVRLGAALASPSGAMTQKVLVTFLVYWAIALFLQTFFFPVLFMYGPGSKGAWTSLIVCAFTAYFLGLFPLGLVRALPLAVSDVLPYVLILFAASVISAPMAVSQYRKEWQ